jgi:hypothetical protein
MPDPPDGEPLPLQDDDADGPTLPVQLVEVQAGSGSQDLRWHPELAAGMPCPQCAGHKLKRHHNTLYCSFCRMRWWCKRPVKG